MTAGMAAIKPPAVATSASATPGATADWSASGALTWTILIAPVVASFVFAPYIAFAIFLIDIYWFIRTGTVVIGIRSTYRQMKRAMLEDWWQRCLAVAVSPATSARTSSVRVRTVPLNSAVCGITLRALPA